jgi:hypothetical protein
MCFLSVKNKCQKLCKGINRTGANKSSLAPKPTVTVALTTGIKWK